MSENFLRFVLAEAAYNLAVAKIAVGLTVAKFEDVKAEYAQAKEALAAEGFVPVGGDDDQFETIPSAPNSPASPASPTEKKNDGR